MPQCPYGSEPATGAPEYVVFDTSNLGGWLGIIASVLTNAMMGLPVGPVPTTQFCAQSPPDDLPFEADYSILWNPAVALTAGAYTRFGNQARQQMFAEVCYCLAPAPEETPCFDADNPLSFPSATTLSTSTSLANEFTVTSALAATAIDYWSPAAGDWGLDNGLRIWRISPGPLTLLGSTAAYPTPKVAGRGRYTLTTPVVLEPGNSYMVQVAETGPSYYLWPSTGTAPMPPLEMHVTYVQSREAYAGAGLPGATGGKVAPLWPVVCDVVVAHDPDPPPALGFPTGYPTAPTIDCSDGASICAKIDTVSNKLDLTIQRIDLIQRQIVPFAYVPGTLRTGLTGHGSFSVQGILGLRVSLTSVPPGASVAGLGAPTIFDAGYLTLGTPDGFLRSEPITHSQFVRLDVSPAITTVTYDLAAGFTANILELVREP